MRTGSSASSSRPVLPVVLRLKNHAGNRPLNLYPVRGDHAWSRLVSWAVAAPMVCLAMALGWHLAIKGDASPGGQSDGSQLTQVQQPPQINPERQHPMPPRRISASDQEVQPASYAVRESDYSVNPMVARVNKPKPTIEQEFRRLPVVEDEETPPKASANRASATKPRGQIQGVFRIAE